jgi:hypothetical protein
MNKSTLSCLGAFRLIVLTVTEMVKYVRISIGLFFRTSAENLGICMSPQISFHAFSQLKKNRTNQTPALQLAEAYENFTKLIIMGDETWVSRYYVETKQQSSQWK